MLAVDLMDQGSLSHKCAWRKVAEPNKVGRANSEGAEAARAYRSKTFHYFIAVRHRPSAIGSSGSAVRVRQIEKLTFATACG